MGRPKKEEKEKAQRRRIQMDFSPATDIMLEKWRSYIDASSDAEAFRKALVVLLHLMDLANDHREFTVIDRDGEHVTVVMP